MARSWNLGYYTQLTLRIVHDQYIADFYRPGLSLSYLFSADSRGSIFIHST